MTGRRSGVDVYVLPFEWGSNVVYAVLRRQVFAIWLAL
jgi:hypothetical protein